MSVGRKKKFEQKNQIENTIKTETKAKAKAEAKIKSNWNDLGLVRFKSKFKWFEWNGQCISFEWFESLWYGRPFYAPFLNWMNGFR